MSEYDDLVTQSLQPDRGQAARAGFAAATDTNPDAYAEAQRVARRTNVPVDTVLNLPREMKRQDAVGAIDFDTLAKTSPATASLLADVERAKIAHDNVDSMGEIERKLRQFGGGAVESVAGMAVGGAGQLLDIAQRNLLGGFARAFLPKPLGGSSATPESLAGPLIGEDWITVGGTIKGFARNDIMVPAAQQTFGDQVAAGLGQVGAQILMLPLTRGVGLFAQGADTMAEKIAPDLAGQGVKDLAVLGGAAVTGITEKWALDKLLGPLAVPIKNQVAASLARIGVASAAEGGQEFTENLLHDTLRKVLTNPDAKIDVGQSLDEGGVGAAVGGIVRSIVEAGLHIRARGARGTQQAEQGAEFIDSINNLAAADKLLARDSDTFERFVAQAAEDGPVQQVFIDAKTLLQSGVAGQVAALSPAVAAQLDTALQTGGQVAIPVEEYAARIAPSEYAPSLLDHLKTAPDGFSRAEAQEYMQGQAAELEQEVERTLAEKQGNDAFKQSAEAVRGEIRTQLDTAARFTPQVNDAYSSMVGNFYAVTAAKIGTTPEELFQRYPLKVGAERIDGPQFEQDALLADLRQQWADAGVKGGVSEKDGIITLSRIVVPEGERNTGKGTGALKALVDYADRTGQHVALSPSGDFGGDKKRLVQFYKRFGFVENKGKNRAFTTSESMYRLAEGKVLHQEARGAFNPANLSITLLKGADLSTFLHESGHFFLEVSADLAAQPNAPAAIQQDINTLLNWFGVDNLAAWRAMAIDEQRAHHEQFARGFEAYLFDGRAPSIELQGLFQRFRAWLLSVYRELKHLNVELTPEVRGVFDRMLASTEQITLAEQGRSMLPLFASPEQAGMTADEFAAYQALGTEATSEAIQDLQARGLRDMTWLHNARGRIIAQLQKEAAAKRAEVRSGVAGEVNALPIYRAERFLRYGELEIPADAPQRTRRAAEQANLEGTKLSLPALKETYGEAENAIWRYLPTGKKGLAATEGLHPDTVAEMFGFSSGDELVRRLLEAPARKEEIEARTDVRMLEQFGDLSSPEAIEKAADKAIHNDARARFVATEANALAKATGQRRVLASAAKEFARAMIARLKVRNVKPSQYANAEVRAAKAAEKASKAGDLATAAAEKRNQLIQNYATRAAYDAQEEVDKGLRYLKKFDSEATRKGLDADYTDQIDALLERFDLRKGQSNKTIDKRTALAEWLKAQREAGFEPDIPPALENEAFRESYKNLTVEAFRGLVDTVRQIEHLGRLKHRLLTTRDQRAYEAVRDEIADSIREHSQGREADTRTPTTNMGRAVQGLKRFWASHIKAATWARVMDGGNDGGPMWEYFVRSANERGDQETTMRAEATGRLSEILAPVFALGKMGGKGQYFPSINRSLNREARIALALNIGNTGNLQRLLGGEGWNAQQITPVLQSLTAQEWAAVQAVWDHFESYRPQIAAKERRVYGKEPEWVNPQPFAITTADGQTVALQGGYYPIKYDPAASQRAEQHADAESAKRQLQGAYTTATTRRSFTKARVDEVAGRPLLYTLSGMYSGVNDVIHDLAWHEWLIDANRLLRSHTIDAAIRNHYGPEAKQQFKTWVQDVAEGEKGADAAVDLALSRLRQGVSAAGLGFNVMSALIQPLGITQSIVRVGAPWVARGVTKYLANPLDLTREVVGKSSFMENRARTRFRELNELRNQVQDQTAFNEFVGRYAYFLMMRCQQMVDVPTWWGAYEKAIAGGNDESLAINLADQAVIDAQGGGQTKDLSAIERGAPAQRLFTVFYSFMNTALNLGVAQTMAADTPAKKARLAVDYAMLYVAPAVLGYFLKNAITPGDSGDDDPEKIAKKLLANQIDYLMGLMVVVREFGEAAKIMAGANDMGRDYTGPAGLRLVADTVGLAKQTHQGEFDDAFRKAAVNVVGDLFGLPSAQINRAITGTKALAEGKTDNPAAVAFGFQERR